MGSILVNGRRAVAVRTDEMSGNVGHRDPVYLFACYLEWRRRRNLAAYHELVAALDEPDCDIRIVAEILLSSVSYTRQESNWSK